MKGQTVPKYVSFGESKPFSFANGKKTKKSRLFTVKSIFFPPLYDEVRGKAVRFQRMPVNFGWRSRNDAKNEVFLARLDAIFSECCEAGKLCFFILKCNTAP